MSIRTNSLSVIITTSRRDELLVESVESVVRQTLPVHEIVVVDDGGPGTAKAALAAFGERVTCIWQPNAGVQAARNTGVAASTGEWVRFLDDDDVLEPEHYALALPLLAGGEVDVVSGDFRKFGEDWLSEQGEFSRWPESFWPMPLARNGPLQVIGSFPPHGIFPTHPFWPSTLTVRRTLVDAIGGWDVRMRDVPAEDYHFVYRVLRAGRLGLVTRPTMRYRVHKGNTASNKALGRMKVFDTILNLVVSSTSEKVALLKRQDALLREARWAARQIGDRERELELSRRMLSSGSLTGIERIRLILAMHVRNRAIRSPRG